MRSMPKITNRPDESQVQEFDKYIEHWQRVLNLGDWRLERGQRPARGAMASVDCDASARLAVYRIGDFGAAKINAETLSLTALHECLHVFLFDLIAAAQDSRSTPEQLEATEHRVINVLERVLGDLHGRSDL
jgi:hypothetical protein